MRTVIDTGPLVALLNRRDAFHEWTMTALERLELPLWTCEPVLTEAAHLCGRAHELTGMLADGALRIGLAVQDEVEALTRLLRRWSGRMDLADACIVRLSELHADSVVLTVDSEFRDIYRRNGRQVIPTLLPPRSR